MMPEATAPHSERYSSTWSLSGTPGSDRSSSWLLCRTGSVLCALPIDQVIEVMRPLAIEQIAGAPQYVSGVSIIRGNPVPVVELGRIIGNRAARSTRLIAIRTTVGTIALAVDSIHGISAIAADALGRLPLLLHDAATEAIDAIGALDSELVVFLRTLRLVPDDLLIRIGAPDSAE